MGSTYAILLTLVIAMPAVSLGAAYGSHDSDSIHAISVTSVDGAYRVGDVVDIFVNLPEPVSVNPGGIIDGQNGYDKLFFPYDVTTVVIDGRTYALIASYGDNGVQIIDITDPSSPVAVASVSEGDSDGTGTFDELLGASSVSTVVIGGNTYALVTSYFDDGLQIIDITDPSNPAVTASVADDINSFDTLDGADDIATVTAGDGTYALVVSNLDDGLQIIDITDPSNPAAVASIVDSTEGNETPFHVLDGVRSITTVGIGSGAYALVASEIDDGIQIINITDPSNPVATASVTNGVDSFDALKSAYDVTATAIMGSVYALVSSNNNDSGIQIIDITDPASPVAVASMTYGMYPNLRQPQSIDTIVINDVPYALVTALGGDTLFIINIEDPSNPVVSADVTDGDVFSELSWAYGVATAAIDGRTYALVAGFMDHGIQMIDITTPSAPTPASYVPRIELDTIPARYAVYAGGSGTSQLTFTYIVQEGDASGDLGYAGSDSLLLNGSILNNGTDITIALPEPASAQSLNGTSDVAIEDLPIITPVGPLNPPGSPLDTVELPDPTATIDLSPSGIVESGTEISVTMSFSGLTFDSDTDYTFRADVKDSENADADQCEDQAGGFGLGVDRYMKKVDEDHEIRTGTISASCPAGNHTIRIGISSPDGTEVASASADFTVAAADTTAPTVASIERSDPTDQATASWTLVFEVTFSEDVTGVDAGDFELSPDSTGGGSSSGRFAQTREPAIPIADHITIQDAITVGPSGTAMSVSVAVDITHTYRGDLVIDLIAPDGTAQTLHSRTGGSANDIDRTYAPDFDGAGIAGDWILRVSDRAGGDAGTLNGWTLTVSHGGADSPVTGLAGSGSQYLVNVSATRDGTYNLDVAQGSGIADAADNPLSSPTPTGADHTYTVSRAAPPPPLTDATLSGLALSGVTLAFAPATTEYTASVAHGVTQTTVAPTVNDGGATYAVKIDGVTDADGVIPLVVGGNVITIEVTAEDGNTVKTYKVTVTRAAPTVSGPAATIELSSDSVDEGTEITVTMSFANLEFDSDTSDTDYIFRADVRNADACEGGGMGNDRYMYQVDEDPEIRAGTISASCEPGDYTVQVSVSSATNVELASATADFTISNPIEQPQQPSADATLSGLVLSGVTLAFAPATTEYTASVAHGVTQTTVTPTTNSAAATYEIRLDGTVDGDGTVPLAVGGNVITIEVTAGDGQATKTYTVTVTLAAPPSADATLSGLALSGVDLGTFDAVIAGYAAEAGNDLAETAVAPTVNHDGATYVIRLGGAVDDDGVMPLSVGENVITVEVTAEDGQTAKTYTVTVTRAAAEPTPGNPPDVPETPAGEVTGRGQVALDWNDVEGAAYYQVRFWSVTDWVELPSDDIGIVPDGSGATVSNLPVGYGYYYFSARAGNAAGVSDWSEYLQLVNPYW